MQESIKDIKNKYKAIVDRNRMEFDNLKDAATNIQAVGNINKVRSRPASS